MSKKLMRQRTAAEAERLASRDRNLTGFFMMTETWILDRLEGQQTHKEEITSEAGTKQALGGMNRIRLPGVILVSHMAEVEVEAGTEQQSLMSPEERCLCCLPHLHGIT